MRYRKEFWGVPALLLLAGCANSVSTYTPLTSGFVVASDEAEKRVASGEVDRQALAQIVIFQNPFLNEGKIPLGAVQLIQTLAIECQRQADRQLAGPLQTGGSVALSYGATGGLGTAAGATWAFPFANFEDYLKYASPAYLASGAVVGMISGSYAQAAAKGGCVKSFWADMLKTRPEYTGTAVEISYAGKSWGDITPPGAYRPLDPEALPAIRDQSWSLHPLNPSPRVEPSASK
jgi:hypothetical protein